MSLKMIKAAGAVTLALAAATSASAATHAPTTKTIYCSQVTPATSHGYIIEEATLTQTGDRYTIDAITLGTGLLTDEGDGTANNGYDFTSETSIAVDPSAAARSPQWRKSLSFRLGSDLVLYIFPEAFTPSEASKDFKARLKKVENGRETNFTLSCNQT